ncbi:hypothetical protein EV363DRAFT_1163211 [Boletus edulis]|uniref:Uncharacterized protein n=1 Tax=Boletus edulis BED1 TaxID=1328754 RepID=A0AAD4BAS0_BOLED|nr:hypothetical protein EV363DRAFT_1163211 [Boletus edulis]KAF8415001.1 hypothetical protein L210DRAFT_3658111 [Boletus edulis BED1]KAF8436286.1 hypothetical protein L210DRAFT_3648042 [Boletus edulis BED1]
MQFSPVLLVLAAAAAVIASPAPLGELNKRTPGPLAHPDDEVAPSGLGDSGPDWKRD